MFAESSKIILSLLISQHFKRDFSPQIYNAPSPSSPLHILSNSLCVKSIEDIAYHFFSFFALYFFTQPLFDLPPKLKLDILPQQT